MKTLYVGVDMAQADFEASIQSENEPIHLGSFANMSTGFQALKQQLCAYENPDTQLHVIVEPTGNYHLGLVAFTHEQGWMVSLPNPQRVRDWAKSQGQRAKNDPLDSRMLTTYGAQTQPTPQTELPTEIVTLDALLKRKEDLEQNLYRERNRLHSLEYCPRGVELVVQQMQKTIAFLEQELAILEQTIHDHIKSYPLLKQRQKHLLTVPGIGPKSVLHILVLLYKWDAHTAGEGEAKGLTAYLGLDPVVYTSGSSINRRTSISKMGNANMRRRLFLCALGGNAAKSGPLVQFYQRLLARNKPKMVALIACARKILVWALAIFRSNRPFDPARAMPAN